MPSWACLIVVVRRAEISGSTTIALAMIRELHLISYSCIAPLQYSTVTAGYLSVLSLLTH
jgi:hypothetical protein